ncbi:S-adenosyl-L-methionine-dependent methyltransferase [Fennellomyces sp. T-0311]|nr:S-adenosyl-L-methionine-dependent methyltransferase [Fennellomyces sp. T-0311]
MSKHAHLLFQVPEGLEFVAKDEINEKLLNKFPMTIVADPNTGRVHTVCYSQLATVLEALKSVHLLSAQSIMVVASEQVIPQSIFDDPEKTCQFISDTTEQTAFDPILFALDPHRASPTFRGTFHKQQVRYSISSPVLASHIGFGFGNTHPEWKVSLQEFDYEIVGTWTREANKTLLDLANTSDEEQPILLWIGVTMKTLDPKYRNRKFFGKTSLNPCIAYCLARLANPKAGQVVLDMCAGTGTIPIEGASCYRNALWIGNEVHEKTLCDKARGNVLHTGLSNVELLLGDGRRLCLRDESVDIILTDLPWGFREGSFVTIQKLYPKFMRQIGRVLRSKGKAYIVTQGHKLFNRVLGYPWCKELWSVDEVKPIAIGGYKVSLYILCKKL